MELTPEQKEAIEKAVLHFDRHHRILQLMEGENVHTNSWILLRELVFKDIPKKGWGIFA